MNKLRGQYLKTYKTIKRQILFKTKRNTKQQEVINDLQLMFLNMQEKQESLEDIQNRLSDYILDIIDTLTIKKHPFMIPTLLGLLILTILIIGTIFIKQMLQPEPLETPVIHLAEKPNEVIWNEVEHASSYKVIIDNEEVDTIVDNFYDVQLKDYDKSHVIQVIAIANNNNYVNSALSEPYLYTVPSRLNTDTQLYNTNYNHIDVFGDVYFDITPDYASNYSLHMVVHNTKEVFSFKVFHQTSNGLVEVLGKNNVYYLEANEGYTVISNSHQYQWKDLVELTVEAQAFDITKDVNVDIPTNTSYILQLKNLEVDSYNFIADNPNLQISILGETYNLLSAHNYVEIQQVAYQYDDGTYSYETYYLLVTNNTSTTQKATLHNEPIPPISLDETIEFTTTNNPQAYEYTIESDVDWIYFYYQSDKLADVNIYEDHFWNISFMMAYTPDGNYGHFHKNTATHLFIVVEGTEETYTGTFHISKY